MIINYILSVYGTENLKKSNNLSNLTQMIMIRICNTIQLFSLIPVQNRFFTFIGE